jgi:hypothetical protein
VTAPKYNAPDATKRNIRASVKRDTTLLGRIQKLEKDVRWLVRLRKSRGKPSADD